MNMQDLTTRQAGALRPLADLETTIRAAAVFELQGALTVGVCLMEAKQQLGRGEWLPWLRKMGISSSYAERRMKLAAEIPPESALNSLNYTQAMAVLALPAGERDAFVIENDAQEKSAAEIKRLIREKEDALRQRNEMAEACKKEQENARVYQDSAVHWKREADYRAQRIEELQAAEPRTVKVVEVPDDYQALKQAAARHQAEMDEAAQAAEEAETRAAAAEAELNRLRRQSEGQAPDEYTAAQGAVNTFLMQVQLLPYNRQAFASLYDRQRFGGLVKAVRDWADEMADALASVGLDGEGAVV